MMYQLFLNLITAHFVGDFYVQFSSWCDDKINHQFFSKYLYIHSFIVAILSWLFIFDWAAWWVCGGIFLTHLIVDGLKSKFQSKYNKGTSTKADGSTEKDERKNLIDLWLFLGDQFIHIAISVGLAYFWYKQNSDWKQFSFILDWMKEHPLRVNAVLALILALKPANFLVLKILEACKVKTEKEDHGNFHSGVLIGWLERGLILLFVILSQYEAIGFLIAAKSILRFNETNPNGDSGNEKSEYVLSGTLLSLSIALCLGIVAVKCMTLYGK